MIILFSLVSYMRVSANETVSMASLPVSSSEMDKFGYDFTGFSIDRETLLVMIRSSISNLSAERESADSDRANELSRRIDGLTSAYDFVANMEEEKLYLSDENGEVIGGDNSLYSILGLMLGGVERLDVDADYDMTPREIIVNGRGSRSVFFKNDAYYADYEGTEEITNVNEGLDEVITGDTESGHLKGFYLGEEDLPICDADGNLMIDDSILALFENTLTFDIYGRYYRHMQVMRSDRYDLVSDEDRGNEEVSVDYYSDDNRIYLDSDFTEEAGSISIPFIDTDGDVRSWSLYDEVIDADGNSSFTAIWTFEPVVGSRVASIEILEREEEIVEEIEPEAETESANDETEGEPEEGTGEKPAVQGARRIQKYPEVIVYTENYIAGYVAKNMSGEAVFTVGPDGSINMDQTSIEVETVDVHEIIAEEIAKWEAENKIVEEDEAAVLAISEEDVEDAATESSSLDEEAEDDETASDEEVNPDAASFDGEGGNAEPEEVAPVAEPEVEPEAEPEPEPEPEPEQEPEPEEGDSEEPSEDAMAPDKFEMEEPEIEED
ncbi:hypothetical protein SAMN02745247_01243 [Butyrivibrio hungatei DSM 14810]|uniref:Uncharacterized protein n=1 Tax=Butyrivibrio hungatei DSM 14810 TaxID=1121132 RepID=A0A1M7S7N4_9FIRM|nr:hypothetical protein SAMN02745247_01243 [Butyrivibrio hungatei DSM 14810]